MKWGKKHIFFKLGSRLIKTQSCKVIQSDNNRFQILHNVEE
jgi:hypothetical protein